MTEYDGLRAGLQGFHASWDLWAAVACGEVMRMLWAGNLEQRIGEGS